MAGPFTDPDDFDPVWDDADDWDYDDFYDEDEVDTSYNRDKYLEYEDGEEY